GTPTDRTVINDAMVATAEAHAVHRFARCIAHAGAQVTDDHIVSAVSARRVVGQTDTIAGSRLAGNRAIRVTHCAWPLKADQTRDLENNGPRTFGLDRGAEAAGDDGLAFGWVVVLEVGDFEHASSAAAPGEPSVALSSRKGEVAQAEAP